MIKRTAGTPLVATDLASTTRIIIDPQGAWRCSIQLVYSNSAPAAVVVNEADVDADANTFTKAGHGFVTGLKVAATTDGTLPAPMTATDYYIIRVDDDTFKVASSLANAEAGTAVNISDVGVDNTTFTPATSAGNVAKIQASNDGENWTDISGDTVTITTSAGNKMYNYPNLCNRYLSVLYTPSAGQINLAVHTNMLVQ
jgi:hypothetical protein